MRLRARAFFNIKNTNIMQFTEKQKQQAISILTAPAYVKTKKANFGTWLRGCCFDFSPFTKEEHSRFIVSGFTSHKRNGDTDYSVSDLSINASVGDIINDKICVKKYLSHPQCVAQTIETTWCDIDFVLKNKSKFESCVNLSYKNHFPYN